MPGLNGTGPLGAGPMTGRGMGRCGVGRGFGPGRGMGLGRGYGRGFAYGAGFYSPEQNKQALEQRAKILEEELSAVKRALQEG